MTEDRKHQLDELSVTDILSYLCTRTSDMEEHIRRSKTQSTIAELKNRNQELLKSCEGATMMYKDLCKAKELIKELMGFSIQLCDCRHTADFEKTREEAERFLKEAN